MKKIIALILFLAVTVAYAQTFQISYNDEQITGPLNLTASLANNDNEFVIVLTNTSEEVDSIYLTKYVLSEVPGSANLFCIGGLCYTDDNSNTPLVLGPGESSNRQSFHLLYNPVGNEGITSVKYIFYTNSYSDSVTINYIYGDVSVEETELLVNNLSAYPNPATSNVSVSYDLSGFRAGSARLVITNLVGSKVAIHPISGTSGKVNVDLSTLDSGIYFYSIEADGKIVSTKKLIVR